MSGSLQSFNTFDHIAPFESAPAAADALVEEQIALESDWLARISTDTLIDVNRFGYQHEHWIKKSQGVTSYVVSGNEILEVGDPANEIEFHTMFHNAELVTSTNINLSIFSIGNTHQVTTGYRLMLDTVSGIRKFAIYRRRVTGESAFTRQHIIDDVVYSPGATFHMVVRMRSAVRTGPTTNSDDGIIEIWINGVLYYTDVHFWDSNETGTTSFLQQTAFKVEGISTQAHIRELFAYDGWTSTTGQQPVQNIVTLADITGVSGSFTKVGPAATDILTITDGDDASYLQSGATGNELELSITPDPLVASLDVVSARVSLKSASLNIRFPPVTAELQNATTSAVLGTDSDSLFFIHPVLKHTSRNVAPSSAVTANNIKFVIRNGV